LHYKISCIRQNAIHQLTSALAKSRSRVVIEDLNVAGMLQNNRLARAVSDMGFFELRRQLEYKGKWYDCEIVVADRFFASTQTCSCCGARKRAEEKLDLSERVYRCDSCGAEIDRDLNAAINLEKYTVVGLGAEEARLVATT
jgi:putative transposase